MFEEEQPILPFSVKDEDGNVVYRDSLTFPDVTAMRNASKAEREEAMQQRYEEWLAIKEEAESTPQED